MKGLGLRKLACNVATVLGRQLGTGLLQLATLALIARVYGPQGNGAYTMALLLPTMLASLLNFGIAPANIYYLGTGKVSPETAWRVTLKIYAGIVAVGLLLGGGVLKLFSQQWFTGVPETMLLIALSIFPVSLLLALVSSLLQGLQQFRQLNLVLLLQPFLTMIIIVTMITTGVRDISWLLAAYLFGSVVTLYSAIRVTRPFLIKNSTAVFQNYGNAVLIYGYKAHLSNILTAINYKVDIFLVNYFVSPTGVGIYVIAVQLSERLWMLSQAFSTVLLPRLSELSTNEEKRKTLTPLIARWVLLITIMGALFLAAIAYPAIRFIFGKQFLGAFTPLLLLLPGIVLGALLRILANDIAARGHPELNMYTSCLILIINIIGNIALIPRYGINGAAIATSIAYASSFILTTIMHHYLTGIPTLSSLMICRDDLLFIKSHIIKQK